MTRNLWTRDELILAFNLYLKLPFGKMHRSTPAVIHLANIINRTPSSIAMRLTNFAHIDPYHRLRGVKGMAGGLKQVLPIWTEFIDNKEQLLFESERILAEKENTTLEAKFANMLADVKDLKGESKERVVKTRVNQQVFRQIVLANYNSKCFFSGMDIPGLLVASHIVPWSVNAEERLNPENGLCLSALYDKAFDKGLIALNPQYKILLSSELKKKKGVEFFANYFAPLEKLTLSIPEKYPPNKAFLQYHLDTIFEKTSIN